jgi:hypothetical protein
MDQDASKPETADATPPTAVSRFTARALQDLLELLKKFQGQSGPDQSAPVDGVDVASAQD